MRPVHPVTSRPLPLPRPVRMRTPTRLPSLHPTQRSAWARLWRALGLAA